MAHETRTATLGGGCFWCLEAVYQELDGVTGIVSGYAGGHVANPTYEEVCGKKTGHAEVVLTSVRASQVGPTLCQTTIRRADGRSSRNGRLCRPGIVCAKRLWTTYALLGGSCGSR